MQLYYQIEDNYHHNGCIIDLLRSMIKLYTLYHSFRLLHRCPKPRLKPSAFKQLCLSIVSSIILALSHWYLVYFIDILPIIYLFQWVCSALVQLWTILFTNRPILIIYHYLLDNYCSYNYYQTEDSYHHNGCIIDLLRSMICTRYHSFRLLHRCRQAKANTIHFQTTVSFYSIIDNSCFSLISCLFYWYLTNNILISMSL